MRRIAILNQKGGVGKTTTTANLGAALGRFGRRVLLIDFDPQAHLSLHFGVEVADGEPSIYDVLTSSMPVSEVARNVRDNITLVPADVDLAGAEAELISIPGREVILREAIDGACSDYDVMLIDCPPSLGVLTINALVAADEVVIPLQAHFLALQGVGKLMETVTLVRQRINPNLTVSGFVLCMHEAATRLAGEVVDDLTGFLERARGTGTPWADACVYNAAIRRNIKLAESSSFGQTVFDYAPTCNGALDYERLAAEMFAISQAPPAETRVSANTSPAVEPAAPKQPQPESSATGCDAAIVPREVTSASVKPAAVAADIAPAGREVACASAGEAERTAVIQPDASTAKGP